MQPCRMSAVALLKAYRSRALSPVEAMQDVLARIAVFEPHIHATYLLEPERALKDARARAGGAASQQVRCRRPSRTISPPRVSQFRSAPRRQLKRRPTRRRSRGCARHSIRQDHHAGLRHAVVRPLQLSSAERNPWLANPAAHRPAPAWRGGRRLARCISAPTSAARSACRPAGAGWSVSSRAADACRSIRPISAASRPAHAQRRRCGADDARAARRPRLHEPAAGKPRLASTAAAPADRAFAGAGCGIRHRRRRARRSNAARVSLPPAPSSSHPVPDADMLDGLDAALGRCPFRATPPEQQQRIFLHPRLG